MPRPLALEETPRETTAQTRRDFYDMLEEIRSEWEKTQVVQAELGAENDRLRWHLQRASVANSLNLCRLDTPHSVSSWNSSPMPLSPVAPSIFEDFEVDPPPINQRRRPSFSSPPAALPVAPPKPDDGQGTPDEFEMPRDSPEGTPRSTATTSEGGARSGSPADENGSNDDSKDSKSDTDVKQVLAKKAETPVDLAMNKRISEEEQNLHLHDIWIHKKKKNAAAAFKRRPGASTPTNRARQNSEIAASSNDNRWVINPNGVRGSLWDTIVVAVLLYDLIFVPLQAFDLPPIAFFAVFEFLITATWTGDMIISFFKGYERNGTVELRLRHVVHHYVTTWFLFDLLVISIDWFLFISMNQGNLVDALWFSRLRRIMRLMRLMRLMKHAQRLVAVFKYVHSENWLVVMRIIWLLLMLVGINHFVCCGWYALGSMSGDNVRWTLVAFDDEDGLGYRYSTAFHWSVTQFTPASMEVVPTNAFERLYCILLIFFGLLIFSAFVSNMTGSMTYLTKIQYEKSHQRELLRRYVHDKNLSMELSVDVINHIGQSSKKKKRLLEKDIACLTDMPKGILERLHDEVHSPIISAHPLFEIILNKDPQIFRAMCHNASTEWACLDGEEIFRFGARCRGMLFTVAGNFQYIGGFGDQAEIFDTVGPGTWFCEAVMWVKWDHHGNLTSSSPGSELALLDTAECHLLLGRSLLITELSNYARVYAKCAARECGSADRVTDVWGQKSRVTDLVAKVFKDLEDVDAGAAKIMAFWGTNNFSDQKIINAWRKYTKKAKRLRLGGVRGAFFYTVYRLGLLA